MVLLELSGFCLLCLLCALQTQTTVYAGTVGLLGSSPVAALRHCNKTLETAFLTHYLLMLLRLSLYSRAFPHGEAGAQ